MTSAHTLTTLARLGRHELDHLVATSTAPDVARLRGVAEGLVLTRGVVRACGVWRGKVFDDGPGPDTATGRNRLGLGTWETRRFRFEARAATSVFSDQRVVHVDHDLPGNPAPVRRFHDELVEVEEGLVLATSHLWRRGRLRFAAHFALDLRGTVTGAGR